MATSDKNSDSDADQGWKYANIGFEFAGSVGLFSLIGYFVDKHWKIEPVGVVTGAITGIIVGFYLLIKEVLMLNNSNSGRFKDESGKSNHTP